MSMVDWKKAKFKKKTGNDGKTPGRQKGPNCKATPIERYMAKRSRSYKHKRYSEWCKLMNGNKPTRNMGGI